MSEQAAPHEPKPEPQPSMRIGGVNIYGDPEIKGDVIGGDQTINQIAGLTGADLNQLFTPLLQVIREAPPERQAEAMQKAEALKSEVAKGEEADDSRMAKLVDGLTELVPSAVSAVVSMFASPILGGLTGPVTKFVLDKIQGK